MTLRMLSLVGMFSSLSLTAGCARYPEKHQGDTCFSLADCNPGKECGNLVECVDGKCDPAKMVELPCEKTCATILDCPEGMHCRLRAGLPGLCVADGSCKTAVECAHLSHVPCTGGLEGSFECQDGVCQYVCSEVISCGDTGCVLAFKGCCGADQISDYRAVRQDALNDWMNRAECQGILCEECYRCDYGVESLCWSGQCIRAVCQLGEGSSGQCTVVDADLFACTADSDCVKVESGLGDCCGCASGGGELTVNHGLEQAFQQDLGWFCSTMDVACDDVSECTNSYPACREGRCVLVEPACNCPPLWDPVCVTIIGEGLVTLPNECQAICLGLEWHYHGDCKCLGDCGTPDPVCATNGQTYYCGAAEAECNGQSVHYPGACNPDCAWCDMVARPWIPVCSENFRDYPDVCFAECQGLDWWHMGECVPGEGSFCGGIASIQCPDENLYCLIDPTCPQCTDPGGSCIVLEHCLEAAHCEGQPIPVPECVGHWTCPDHTCTWVCGY